ncbi:UNVERIFIED_CONTAM: hypothetical protein FKN15_075739 [Acipenser sinensis]
MLIWFQRGDLGQCLNWLVHVTESHKVYRQKLDELTNLQTICSNSISKHKKNLGEINYSLRRCKKEACTAEERELIQSVHTQMKERQNVFFDMEAYLPKKNGLYLNLVLGNVNVTLLSNQAKCKKEACTAEERELIQSVHTQMKERQNVFFDMEAYLPKKNGFAYKDEYEKFKLYMTIILLLGAITCRFFLNYRFAYKDEYEKFKLYMTIILLLGAITCRFFLNYRVIDEIFNFMLVWYYCTLTIRESILISNGSRPNGFIYKMFRNQFLAFSIYQSFVQFLQYYYQSGCLYRLRALGERNHLDLIHAFIGKTSGSFIMRYSCLDCPDMKNAKNGK